jgi:multimeric flavodoxin WrbA
MFAEEIRERETPVFIPRTVYLQVPPEEDVWDSRPGFSCPPRECGNTFFLLFSRIRKKAFIFPRGIFPIMKILGIATSPRKGANSQSLVEHILAGAKKAGAKTELVRLCDMDISPCTGCNSCKSSGECIIEDDMEELWEKMAKADAIVLGSPVYWGRLNAQAYPFIDRFYAHLKPDFTTDFPNGKKIVLALTFGGMPPEALVPLNAYVKATFGYLGFTDAGFIWQNQCMGPRDLAKFPETIKKAEELGKTLAK